MQDLSIYSQMKPQFPEQEHLKCPRCDSANTKFCYYNNYNLSQPRHFCKNCRRYWTKGGALRNIPVGGGSRKNTKRTSSTTKRASSTSTSSSSATSTVAAAASEASSTSTATTQMMPKTEAYGLAGTGHPGFDHGRRMMMVDVSGSFSSLLSSSGGQFGNFIEGLNPNGSNLQLRGGFGDPDPIHIPGQDPGSGHHVDGPQMGLANGSNADSSWNGSGGWPDLAIYTPGSDFQ